MKLKDILFEFGLFYDKNIHAGMSFAQVEFKQKQGSKTEDRDTSRDKWVKGRLFIEKDIETIDGVTLSEWDREGLVVRSEQINSKDLQIIKARNLKSDKYMNYKQLWAQGLSISEAEKEAGRRFGWGYKERTTETYFSAINAANPSPIGLQ